MPDSPECDMPKLYKEERNEVMRSLVWYAEEALDIRKIGEGSIQGEETIFEGDGENDKPET